MTHPLTDPTYFAFRCYPLSVIPVRDHSLKRQERVSCGPISMLRCVPATQFAVLCLYRRHVWLPIHWCAGSRETRCQRGHLGRPSQNSLGDPNPNRALASLAVPCIQLLLLALTVFAQQMIATVQARFRPKSAAFNRLRTRPMSPTGRQPPCSRKFWARGGCTCDGFCPCA